MADDNSIFDALLLEALGVSPPDVRLPILRLAMEEGLIVTNPSKRHSRTGVETAEANPPSRTRATFTAWVAASIAVAILSWITLATPRSGWTNSNSDMSSSTAIGNTPMHHALGSEPGSTDQNPRMLLLRRDSPHFHADGLEISDIDGVVLVSANGIPSSDNLRDFTQSLRQTGRHNEKEIEMALNAKRWFIVGGFAVCVLAGNALVNHQFLQAQDADDSNGKASTEEKEESEESKAAELLKEWDDDGDGEITKADGVWVRLKRCDADEDGKVTAAEYVACLKAEKEEREAAELLKEWDDDGDGEITKADGVWARLKRCDADEDGKVTAAEYVAFQKANGVFNKLDTDNDGRITEEEAKALGEGAADWTKEHDGDEDGVVTREELESSLKKESK